MRKLPPLGSLRAFEAAARHLSFREAADELGVTPTAISHQIRILEEMCGQPLFRRRPRPLELTSAGERLFPELLQEEATAEAISELAVEMLLQPERLLYLKQKLADTVRANLGEPGGVRRAADLLYDLATGAPDSSG